jgi:hypothetical protein
MRPKGGWPCKIERLTVKVLVRVQARAAVRSGDRREAAWPRSCAAKVSGAILGQTG